MKLTVWIMSVFVSAAVLAVVPSMRLTIYAFLLGWIATTATVQLANRATIASDLSTLLLAAFVIWIAVSGAINGDPSFSGLALMSTCAMAFAVLSRRYIGSKYEASGGLCALICAVFLAGFVPMSSESEGQNYSNFFSAIIAFLGLRAWSGGVRFWHFVFVAGLGVYMGTRAITLASTLSCLIHYALILPRPAWLKGGVTASLLAAICAIPILFALYTEYRFEIDTLAIQWTGKRLETGRVEIWEALLGRMSFAEILLGGGASSAHFTVFDATLSSHNGYLAVLLSYGLVGLSIAATLLVCVFRRLVRQELPFSAAMLVFFATRELFEVSLFMNSFPVALIFWSLVATGYLERCLPMIPRAPLGTGHKQKRPFLRMSSPGV